MRCITTFVLISTLAMTAACGRLRGTDSASDTVTESQNAKVRREKNYRDDDLDDPNRTTIWDAFKGKKAEQTVQVNRYIWAASLDVLDFLPIQSVDPFTGVIVTGYGTPPGGGRSYRATVHIKDPALEARSLNVALQSRNGPVSAATARAIEDAILSRARQLRMVDKKI